MLPAAVVFDLDDTLLHDDLTISAYTISVLRSAAGMGVAVIPASGRARDSMRPFVDELGCAACYIACNGAEIWSPSHTLVHRVSFPEEVSQRIAAFGTAHGCYFQTYEGSHFYYNEESEWAAAYAKSSMLTGLLTPDLSAFLTTHPSSKILMMDTPARIAELLREAKELFEGQAAVTCSKPYFLEFNPPEATKGKALARCGEALGFSLQDAIAFGDSLNDLSMLQAAGRGIAVANARPDVLARVREACGTNNDDGPARLIQSLLA